MNRASPLPETIARYLLGELPEAEREAFEDAFFADAALFDAVLVAETALVEDFVRQRMAEPVRRQFEAHYLADARRRERVRFAEALADVIDRTPSAQAGALADGTTGRVTSRARSVWVPWAAAAAILLAAGVGLWLNTYRVPLGAGQQARTSASGTAGTAPGGSPAPGVTTPVAIATLAIAINPGTRRASAAPSANLTLVPSITEVRLLVTVREPDYSAYRGRLRQVGGEEIAVGDDVATPMGAPDVTLTLAVPAGRLAEGDYLLTVQGRRDGDFEDVSQSVVSVIRR